MSFGIELKKGAKNYIALEVEPLFFNPTLIRTVTIVIAPTTDLADGVPPVGPYLTETDAAIGLCGR